MGFTEVPQEPYIMIKDGIIYFFFMDDIVFAFKKYDTDNLTQMTSLLKNKFIMKELSELK